jgi:PRC-barrel domain
MKKMLAAATSVSITLLASGLGFAQTDGTQSSNARPAAARDMTNAPGSPMQPSWYTHQENDLDASKLIGAPVRNEEGHLIGTKDGVVLSNDGQVAVVIVVGSDLGFGEREVAVNLKSLRLSKDENNNLVVTLNATKDALKNAPEWTQPQ